MKAKTHLLIKIKYIYFKDNSEELSFFMYFLLKMCYNYKTPFVQNDNNLKFSKKFKLFLLYFGFLRTN